MYSIGFSCPTKQPQRTGPCAPNTNPAASIPNPQMFALHHRSSTMTRDIRTSVILRPITRIRWDTRCLAAKRTSGSEIRHTAVYPHTDSDLNPKAALRLLTEPGDLAGDLQARQQRGERPLQT